MTQTMHVWQPRYALMPAIVRCLMQIDAERAVGGHKPMPVA
jgi:hypothetical protein